MKKKYFASLPTNELLPELEKRVQTFNRYIENKGFAEKWRKAYDLYYGRHMDEGSLASGEIEFVGDDGELTAYGVNHFRSLIKNIMAMTTAQKPDFDPRAVNTDLKSIQQCKIAAAILDSYLDEKRMNRVYVSAAERSLVQGKGFVVKTWDPSLGESFSTEMVEDPEKPGMALVDPETGEPVEKIVREGDVNARAKGPFDVMYDTKLRDYSKRNWEIVREWENKWDLAARHPAFADDLVDLDGQDVVSFTGERANTKIENNEDCEDDLIPVYYFIHRQTDACPEGRFTKFVSGEIALFDGPTPYEDQLISRRITPGEMFDSAECYSESFDLMALQEVYNVLVSTAFTNQSAFGRPVIHMPDGVEVSESGFAEGGPVFLKGGPPDAFPRAIQLCATPPEIFQNIGMIQKQMETLTGANSVVRGDPEHSLKSGAALGRMQAMAIQQNSPFQRSYAELLEDGGAFLFFLVKKFVKTERIATYAGINNRAATLAFDGEKISNVNRVVVDLGNPLTRTAAGRQDLADSLLQKGLIKDPQQYFTVIKTGNLDPMTEGPESQNDLIRKENEDLMEGKPAKAMVGDKHLRHTGEHFAILNDTQIRQGVANGDPSATQIVQNVLAHIEEHKELFLSQEPFYGMVSGEPPPPPPPMPPGMPGPMGPGAPPPPPGGGGPPQQPADAPPIPDMPDLPPAPPMGG